MHSISFFIIALAAFTEGTCPDQDGTTYELWSDPATWDNNVT